MSRYHREGVSNCLVGVRSICQYAKMGHKTFYRMQKRYGFPAMRLPDGRWYTTKTLIDEWIRAQCKAQREAEKARQAVQSHMAQPTTPVAPEGGH